MSNTYLQGSNNTSKNPNDGTGRKPLPPPRNKNLPQTPSPKVEIDSPKNEKETKNETDTKKLPTLPSQDNMGSVKISDRIKELNGMSKNNNVTPIPKKETPTLPKRDTDRPVLPLRKPEDKNVKLPKTPTITSENVDGMKSPRQGDESKQKTPPPRPVSKIVLKGDLQEVNQIATSPQPLQDRKVPIPTVLKKEGDSDENLRRSMSKGNLIRNSERRNGFIIYIPKTDETEMGNVIEEKEKKKVVKTQEIFQVSDEIKAKYNKPTEKQKKAAQKIQNCIRKHRARKFFLDLKRIDYTREKVCREFLETEVNYVTDMKVLLNVYAKAFKENSKSEKPIISAQDATLIFSDVEVIIGFNDAFLKKLSDEMQHYDRFKTNIADIVLEMAPFFKTYTRYCNNYDRTMQLVSKNKLNPDFKTFLANLDKDEKTNKLGLQSYLIKPIQRIPRYRLLLQDLLKHTHKEHKGYKKIEDSIEKIKEVADHLNEAVRAFESTEKLLEIQAQFVNKFNLIEPHRKPIKNGYYEFKDSNGSKVHIHLFNDCVIHSLGSVGSFSYRGKLDFSTTVLYEWVGDEKDRDTKFQLKSLEEEIILYAPSSQSKQDFLKKVYDTIEQYKNERKDQKTDVHTLQDDTATTFSVAMSEENYDITASEAIKVMKEGQVLLKYCRSTKPHFRKFLLTEDEKTLVWGSPNKTTTESQVQLKAVKRLMKGQKTQIFERYKNPDLDELSFSLLYENRTLDIVCKDKREFIIWVTGITYLLSKAGGQPNELSTQTLEKKTSSTINLLQTYAEESKKFKESFSQIGDAFTWGQGTRGALGNGKQEDNLIPIVVKDFLYLDVDQIFCENSAGFVLTTGGEFFSWGSNDSGRLGHGDESDRFLPTLSKPLQGHKITQVALGSTHTLALEDNGSVWGFGSNKYGQLGIGSSDEKKVKPSTLPFWKDKKVKQISCGSWHTVVTLQNGECYSFGRGEDGQLGLGDKNNRDTPTLINGLKDKKVVNVSLGSWHSLALLDDGSLYSWGNETYGQTGHDSLSNTELCLHPKEIIALKDKKVIQISAGSSHNAVIVDKGDIYTWGNGLYGQIGNNKKEHFPKPKLVVDLVGEKAKLVACGVNHVLALMHSGKVFAWGAGTYGRLGIGSEQDKYSPQLIELFGDKVVRSIAAGGSNSAAVCAHQWVPDKDAKECMQCKEKFTLFFRRHHCRNCGGLYCGNCTQKRIILLRFGFDAPVRVCDNCYQILSKK